MLKKSSGMKIILSLVITLCLIPLYCSAAELTDLCNNLIGKWEGQWKSRAGRVNCKWKAIADASKLGKKVMFEVTLQNGTPFILCKRQEIFTLIGTCKNSEITFNMDLARQAYLFGQLNENTISLSGDDISVTLKKKSA